MSPQVREAGAADLAVLAPLFDRYRQFYGQPADLARSRDFLAERLARAESTVLLAFVDGRAAGFTQLYPSFSSTRAARIYILNDLYVAEHARRAGAGRRLVEAATAFARAQGAAGLTLSTGVENRPAQRLYEALGWARESGFYEYGLVFGSTGGG